MKDSNGHAVDMDPAAAALSGLDVMQLMQLQQQGLIVQHQQQYWASMNEEVRVMILDLPVAGGACTSMAGLLHAANMCFRHASNC
jgi:hypothetical protein